MIFRRKRLEVEIVQGKDKQWYYRVRARNGEIVSGSEGYTRKSSAKRAATNLFVGVPQREV